MMPLLGVLLLAHVIVAVTWIREENYPPVDIKATHDFCVNLYPPGYNGSHKTKIRHTVIVLDVEKQPDRMHLDGSSFITAAVKCSPRRKFNAAIFQFRMNDSPIPIGYFEKFDMFPQSQKRVDCPPGKQNTVWVTNYQEVTNAVVFWMPNRTLEARDNVTVMVTVIKKESDGIVFDTAPHVYYPSLRRNLRAKELSSYDSEIYVKDLSTGKAIKAQFLY